MVHKTEVKFNSVTNYNKKSIEDFTKQRYSHITQSPFEKYRLELMRLLVDNSLNGVVLDIGRNIGTGARIYSHKAKRMGMIFPFKYPGFSTIVQLQKLDNEGKIVR